MSRSRRVSDGGADASFEGIREIAVDWISRRDDGLSPTDEVAFQAWIATDPRHAAAIDALQPVWSAISGPRYAGRGGDLRRDVAKRVVRTKRRRSAIGVSSLAAAAVLAFAFLSRPSSALDDAGPTIALRPDRHLLPDGSTIELNFGAEISAEFTPARRAVRLLWGEALFHVARDDSRPFVVTAGNIAVHAVGTAFTVRFDPKQVDVLVTEGRVAVEQNTVPASTIPATGQSSNVPVWEPLSPVVPVFLSAGRRLVFPAGASMQQSTPQRVSSDEVATVLAWRKRRIEFNGTPLAEAVEIFNRDNAVQLSVGNSATGELRISGVYWTNDPEAFSRVVGIGLGIEVLQVERGKIILQK